MIEAFLIPFSQQACLRLLYSTCAHGIMLRQRLLSAGSNGYLTLEDEPVSLVKESLSCSKPSTFWPLIERLWQILRPPPPAIDPVLVASTTSTASTSNEGLLLTTKSSCIISTEPMNPIMALKISQDAASIKQEYATHKKVEAAFKWAAVALGQMPGGAPLPYVPVCFDCYPHLRWTEFCKFLDYDKQAHLRSAAYTMEYIRPLHLHHVKYLVKRHLSQPIQRLALEDIGASSFLPEVCLGDLSPLPDRWQPKLHQRAVYADQLEQERVNVLSVAEIMGVSLAVMHWGCHIDGAGVKFVLGCDRKGRIHMWLTRFGECRTVTSVRENVSTQLVDAVMHNSACWPRWINLSKYRRLWSCFRQGYIRMALLLHDEEDSAPANKYLPLAFLNELQQLRGPPKKTSWKGISVNGTV